MNYKHKLLYIFFFDKYSIKRIMITTIIIITYFTIYIYYILFCDEIIASLFSS